MTKEMENELKTAQALREEAIKEHRQMQRRELDADLEYAMMSLEESRKEYEQMRPELAREAREAQREYEEMRVNLGWSKQEAIENETKLLLANGNFLQFYPIQKNLAKFMMDLLACPEGETIYNPYAGVGSFSTFALKHNFVQRDMSEDAYEIAKLRAQKYGIAPQIEKCNPRIMTDKWSYIIAMPPFLSATLDDAIMHLYSQLEDEGAMCLLLPASFVNSKSFFKSKELLLLDGALQSVFLMPSNLLTNSGVSTVVVRIFKSSVQANHKAELEDPSVSLWDLSDFYVENKRKHTRELMPDLLAEAMAEEFVNSSTNGISVPSSMLLKNGCNLLPKFYMSRKMLESFQHDYPMVTLGELLQPVPQEKVSTVCKNISMKDLAKGEIVLNTDFGAIEPTNCEGKACYLLNGDILIALMGTKLQPTIYSGKEPLQVMLSSNIAALRVCNADQVSPEYIVTELSAPYAQKHVDMFRIGMTQQSISLRVLLDEVQIELPSPEEQQKKLLQRTIETQKRVLEQQGIAYDELLDARRNEYYTLMRFRKHEMSQFLLHLNPEIDSLMSYFEEHGGTVRSTDIISERTNRTVADCLLSIRSNMTKLTQSIKHLTDDAQYDPAEDIHVSNLLRNYIETHPASTGYRFELIQDPLLYQGFEFPGGLIDGEELAPSNMSSLSLGDFSVVSISQKDFYTVLDNIVANAIKYGFKESKDYIIRIGLRQSTLGDQPAVEIIVANNGKPLPKGMTEEKVFVLGCSSSKSTGIGGWQMKNIIENFHGKIDLHSYPEAEDGFTVEYVITLPITNIQKIYANEL